MLSKVTRIVQTSPGTPDSHLFNRALWRSHPCKTVSSALKETGPFKRDVPRINMLHEITLPPAQRPDKLVCLSLEHFIVCATELSSELSIQVHSKHWSLRPANPASCFGCNNSFKIPVQKICVQTSTSRWKRRGFNAWTPCVASLFCICVRMSEKFEQHANISLHYCPDLYSWLNGAWWYWSLISMLLVMLRSSGMSRFKKTLLRPLICDIQHSVGWCASSQLWLINPPLSLQVRKIARVEKMLKTKTFVSSPLDFYCETTVDFPVAWSTVSCKAFTLALRLF